MKTTYIDIAGVIVAIAVVASCFYFGFRIMESKDTKQLQQIQAQERTQRHVIDSLVADHSARLAKANAYAWQVQHERDSLVQVINTRIEKIKIQYDQKVDHVALLPADSLLRLFTDQLSH